MNAEPISPDPTERVLMRMLLILVLALVACGIWVGYEYINKVVFLDDGSIKTNDRGPFMVEARTKDNITIQVMFDLYKVTDDTKLGAQWKIIRAVSARTAKEIYWYGTGVDHTADVRSVRWPPEILQKFIDEGVIEHQKERSE
jgi:hypothetical protein